MNDNNMLKLGFYYKNEFGEESKLEKTFTPDTLDMTSQFDLLVDEFKNFLVGAGFSTEHVDKIKIVEEEKTDEGK